MNRAYDIITFDCYGTLVDWETGISRAFIAAAAEDGVRLDREEVLAAHSEIEPQVQLEPYRSYADVLTEVARRAAPGLGWAIDDSTARFLPRSLPGWPVFEDTPEALARLQTAGYRLGILSNIDDGLLRETVRGLGASFDLIVTAEQVQAYKPAEAHFLTARRTTGNERWLHAAQSWFHDIVPATRLGIPTAWINRNHDPRGDDGAPDLEVHDLAGLAERLCTPQSSPG